MSKASKEIKRAGKQRTNLIPRSKFDPSSHGKLKAGFIKK